MEGRRGDRCIQLLEMDMAGIAEMLVAAVQAKNKTPVRVVSRSDGSGGTGASGRSVAGVPVAYSNRGPVQMGQTLSNDPRFPV